MIKKKGSIMFTMIIMIFVTMISATIAFSVALKIKNSRLYLNEREEIFNLEKEAYEKINNYILEGNGTDIVFENEKYSFSIEKGKFNISVVFNLEYEIFEWRITKI